MSCDPKEAALKSFFLGPQSENSEWFKDLLGRLFDQWVNWRRSIFPNDGRAISEADLASPEFQSCIGIFEQNLDEILMRFQSEIPKFSPRYIGHMFSEVSLPALLGHIVSLVHNPNNISSDASRVGIQIENEAIGFLAEMIGYDPQKCRGHFTSGGTLSNYEALVRARYRLNTWLSVAAYRANQSELSTDLFRAAHIGWSFYEETENLIRDLRLSCLPWSFLDSNPFDVSTRLETLFHVPYRGPVVLIPENKHYSWEKGVSLLGLGREAIWKIALDREGKISLQDLKTKIRMAQKEQRPVLMVVSIAGTTEMGEIDRTDEVQNLLDTLRDHENLHIWHHVDAAYGGFFCSLDKDSDHSSVLSSQSRSALRAIRTANSVTLDPHKLGYVPYSSGAFFCRDKREYQTESFEAPYVFHEKSLNQGLRTLEGSRSATGATATWLTSKCIGFHSEGYGRILARTIKARIELENLFRKKSSPIQIAPHAETNILCLAVAKNGMSLSEANQLTLRVLEQLSSDRNSGVFLSKTVLSVASYKEYISGFVEQWGGSLDADSVVLLRLCLMNPFFTTKETKVRFPDAIADLIWKVAERVCLTM